MNHFLCSRLEEPPKRFLDGYDPSMWSDGGPSQGGLVHVMDALWSSGGQKALSDALSQELETLLTTRSPDRRRSSEQLQGGPSAPSPAEAADTAAREQLAATPPTAAEDPGGDAVAATGRLTPPDQPS